jgi:hypothetical protein
MCNDATIDIDGKLIKSLIPDGAAKVLKLL